MAEHQKRAAAGLAVGMEFDADQFERGLRRPGIDIARFAGQHPVEAQCGDQAARRGFAGQRLFPVQPVHADDEPLLVLPPDDVGDLYAGLLHMRRDHREVIGVKRNQFERRVQDGILGVLHSEI